MIMKDKNTIRIDWYIIILHDEIFRSMTLPPQDIFDKSSCILPPGNYPIPIKGSLDVFSNHHPLLEQSNRKSNGKTVTVRCKVCNIEFSARIADRRRGWAKCCSKSCAAKLSNSSTGKYTLKHDDDDEAYLVEDGSWDAHKGYF